MSHGSAGLLNNDNNCNNSNEIQVKLSLYFAGTELGEVIRRNYNMKIHERTYAGEYI